jgi:hypothetical protein
MGENPSPLDEDLSLIFDKGFKGPRIRGFKEGTGNAFPYQFFGIFQFHVILPIAFRQAFFRLLPTHST